MKTFTVVGLREDKSVFVEWYEARDADHARDLASQDDEEARLISLFEGRLTDLLANEE